MSAPLLLVMGAGAIGCFIGGRLAEAGAAIRFVARPRVAQALREQGLTLSDVEDGARQRRLAAATLCVDEAVPQGLRPTLVLLCVKSGATAEAARELGQALPPGTPVLSLQNGVSNASLAQAAAPQLVLVPGVVGFNVAELGPGRYHRGTSGMLAGAEHPALRALQPLFAQAGLPLALHAQLLPLQWGKLLLNLGNPVNALSGLTLKRQLLDRDLRRVMAALQREALAALQAAGIPPARLTPVPARWLPSVLGLPTPLFRLVAARSLRIDERARTSMADDLARGRKPEVDAICGEVVRLATAHGLDAPLNRRIGELVLDWPNDPRPRSGARLLRDLGMQ